MSLGIKDIRDRKENKKGGKQTSIDLKNISKNQPRKPIMVLHGPEGIGKTTFAYMSPGNIFLPTEDGPGDLPINNVFGDDKPKAESFDDVLEALKALFTQEHSYQTLVVDSLDALEKLIWAATCERNNETTIEKIGGGFGKGYIEADKEWKQFWDGIAALRNKKNMSAICIAHSQIITINDPTQPSYEKYTLNLNKRAISICTDTPDIVGFAHWRVYTTKEKGEDRYRATTSGERILGLTPKPYRVAKNRYHMADEVELLYPKFVEALPESVRNLMVEKK